jgi:hypothetical protein
MKITYFAILLAATILSRNVVAQEETPTPSLSTDSRIEKPSVSVRQPTTDLRKKPTPTPYRPRPDTTLNPPPYRPRPDTTSRITPTPVPDTPFDPFSGQLGPHPGGSNRRTFTFPNGVHVEIETLGDDVAFTYANGHRRVVHKHDLNHRPTGAHPEGCAKMLHILLRTNPESPAWRRMCVDYINQC